MDTDFEEKKLLKGINPDEAKKRFYDENGEEIIKHEPKHGCVLVLKRKYEDSKKHFLKIYYCIKHDVEVCGGHNGSCGLPFGRHIEYRDLQEFKKNNK